MVYGLCDIGHWRNKEKIVSYCLKYGNECGDICREHILSNGNPNLLFGGICLVIGFLIGWCFLRNSGNK